MDNVIESSSSNASVVHDIKSTQPPESKPMPINININNHTRKFDWIIYKYTIKQLNINAEYKALRHFNRFARPGSKTHVKYLRNLYGIMPYFNEQIYMKYTNLNPNITLEQLYIYFRTEGYKKYPLNDEYDRLYYNIDSIFDVDTYYKCYQDEIENYLYSDDNYDVNSDEWETGSQISSITSMSNVSDMSIATIQTRNSMLSGLISNANNHRRGIIESHDDREMQTIQNQYNNWKENLYNWYDIPDTLNKKIYKFYKEHGEKYPLNNKYFMLKYKITDPLFDLNLYCKMNNINYNKTNMNEVDNTYSLFSKNKKLDDNYYKAYYNIPNDLDLQTFIKRYDIYFEDKQEYLKNLEQEQKNYVYMVFNKLCQTSDFSYCDSYYYRILHNIPEDLNYNIYISCYPKVLQDINTKNLKDVNSYIRISKEEKYLYENIQHYMIEYTLNDEYYRLFYKIPEELDYFIFINSFPDVVEINNLKTESEINNFSEFVKKSVLLDNKKLLYKYYSENKDKYIFDEDYYKQYYYMFYNIPKELNESVYINMHNELKKNILNIGVINKETYYQIYYSFLNEHLEKQGLNDEYYYELDKYYRLEYNIPSDFDSDLYLKVYPQLHETLDNSNNKQLYEQVDLEKMPLNDNYYRLKHKIPELLDPVTYVKRYPDIKDELINLQENSLEYNKKVYDLCETLLTYFKLDDKYFIIKYNISKLYHEDCIELFKNKYNIKYTKIYNNQYHAFGEEGQKLIDLTSDEYLHILFNLDENFDWNTYYSNNNELIENSKLDIEENMDENIVNKLKCFCHNLTNNTNILDYINNYVIIKSKINKKKQYNIDSDFDYLQYSQEHHYFYMNTRIKITPDFVYMFYKELINLEDIYNLFKHNIQHEHIETTEITQQMIFMEQKFIDNYEYIMNSKVYIQYHKDLFVLKDYINNIQQITDNNFDNDELWLQINNKKFLHHNPFFEIYKKLDYTILLDNFQNKINKFSENITNINIAYIYQSYNNTELDVVNFLYSLQYIPSNVNVYILTNHNMFDNIIDNNIIKVNWMFKNKSSLLPDNIKEDYVFIWNSNYVMKGDHIFIREDINDDILLSNTIKKYINTGILRKNNTNTFLNIDSHTDLIKFRKHNKYNLLIK